MGREITTPRTLKEAIRYFADPDVALEYAKILRWPDGIVKCPLCGSTRVWFLASSRLWKCQEDHPCRKFSVKKGSIMEDSPLGIDIWLSAIWLLATCKNGISSYEIHRGLGITQKSGWFLLQRIRLAMQTGTFEKMGGSGPVEVDETFIGGKARFMHKDKKAQKIKGTGGSGKVAVAGLLARHGHGGKKHSTVRVQVVGSRKQKELDPLVRQHVEPGSEIMTDELASYGKLAPDYVHNVVNHAERYVEGQRAHERAGELLVAPEAGDQGHLRVASSPSTCSATWTSRPSGSTSASTKTATRAGSTKWARGCSESASPTSS